jgi:hypothetical protein
MCRIKIQTFEFKSKTFKPKLISHDEFSHDEMKEKSEWFVDNFFKN